MNSKIVKDWISMCALESKCLRWVKFGIQTWIQCVCVCVRACKCVHVFHVGAKIRFNYKVIKRLTLTLVVLLH